jgi:hypothetical protein
LVSLITRFDDMNIYEYNGVIYNLDQLVSLAESDSDGPEAWAGKRVLALTFSSGLRINVPLTERERIERLIQRGETTD